MISASPSVLHRSLTRFMPKTRRLFWGEAQLLRAFHITKSKRIDYDHTMLQLHDCMKQDTDFQDHSPQIRHDFPANSMWAVFTDLVAHAVIFVSLSDKISCSPLNRSWYAVVNS